MQASSRRGLSQNNCLDGKQGFTTAGSLNVPTSALRIAVTAELGKDNHQVRRYEMTKQEIIDQAVWAALAMAMHLSVCRQAKEETRNLSVSLKESASEKFTNKP